MCCKLPPVPEVEKPENVWCRHCTPGAAKPCTIYPTRPPVCVDFACGWLINDGVFGAEWKPSRSKIVPYMFLSEGNAGTVFHFMVDPGSPNRWREAPYYQTIKQVAVNGLAASGASHFMTFVLLNPKASFLILPTKDFKTYPGEPLMTVNESGVWDVRSFPTAEARNEYAAAMQRDASRRP
jgi:hypothetical protein